MDWLGQHYEMVGGVVAAVSGLWALLSRIDKVIRSHLRQEFATKTDLERGLGRLDKKLDKVLIAFHLEQHNRDEYLTLLKKE